MSDIIDWFVLQLDMAFKTIPKPEQLEELVNKALELRVENDLLMTSVDHLTDENEAMRELLEEMGFDLGC